LAAEDVESWEDDLNEMEIALAESGFESLRWKTLNGGGTIDEAKIYTTQYDLDEDKAA